jgi:phosphatidylserine synthase
LIATALMMASASAQASGPEGYLTFFVGTPLLLAVAVFMGFVLARRSTTKAKLVAGLVFVPTMLFSVYLIPDALALIRRGPRMDAPISYAFFGLLALVCCQFVVVASRKH